jgi:hypothetical protein
MLTNPFSKEYKFFSDQNDTQRYFEPKSYKVENLVLHI